MPTSLFGKDLNTITSKEIDSFIFGTKPSTETKAGGYSAPAITSGEEIEALEATSQATALLDVDAVLISDGDNGGQVDDQVVDPPGDVTRGNAYEKMETAVIGAGVKSRTDLNGARSFVNPLAIIHHANCNTANDFLDDETQGNGAYKKTVTAAGVNQDRRELTIDGLIRDFSDKVGPESGVYSTPYRLADFLYCKYFQKIPLNHMITLRRFAHPTYDNLTWGKYGGESGTAAPATVTSNITKKGKAVKGKKGVKTPKAPAHKPVNADAVNKSSVENSGTFNYKPIAQAVTFFGESTGNDLDKMTTIKGEIAWKELTADVNKYEQDSTNGNLSADQTPFGKNKIINTVAKGVSALNGTGNTNRDKEVNDGNQIGLFDAHWANKVYGPVDSVVKTQIRDRGVHATYKIDLTFEYELRSWAGINPRIAMLDIIANMLALTFNNAKFWGGANIFFPNHPQFAFLGGKKAQNELYSGKYGDYLNTVFGATGQAFGKGFDILKTLGSAVMNLDFSKALKTIADNLGNIGGDLISAKNRPATMAVRSLITGQPNGCWHLTVGNPYRPILKMGNMIVKDWEMSFGGFMGVDDFPSEVKYRVTLETCRPVDKGGVESWLNGIMESRADGTGGGRLYYASKEMKEGAGQKILKDSRLEQKGTGGKYDFISASNVDKTQISDNSLADAAKQIDQASGSLF